MDMLEEKIKAGGGDKQAADISVIKEQLLRILDGEEPEPGFDDSVFAMDGGRGKELHRAFSDEEMLSYLRSLAKRLNHPPSQKEVHWAMKDYIKIRFKRWPYALEKAGLSKTAGSGGRSMDSILQEEQQVQEMLNAIRQKALDTGRLPHPGDFPEMYEVLCRHYKDWNQVLRDAKVEPAMLNKVAVKKIPDLEPEYMELLEQIKRFASEIGRSPTHGEVDEDVKRRLIERCGSWRNALYQIGLEPVVRFRPFRGICIDKQPEESKSRHTNDLTDCCYRVLNMTEQDRKDLEHVKSVWLYKGTIPAKKDVPKEIRKRLIAVCGSWANVMYQLGVQPKDYYTAVEEETKRRRQEQQKQLRKKQSQKTTKGAAKS